MSFVDIWSVLFLCIVLTSLAGIRKPLLTFNLMLSEVLVMPPRRWRHGGGAVGC